MWSTIANLKENLNKIAQDVHDDEDDDDLEIYGAVNGGVTSPVSDRRNSHGFAHSMSVSRSPLANGIDSANNPELRTMVSKHRSMSPKPADSERVTTVEKGLVVVQEVVHEVVAESLPQIWGKVAGLRASMEGLQGQLGKVRT
ncbi:hypothetical protein L484_022473 [Morus notabilis]|uniref:Uncharacterized protein n=1 Tax=Morus notabilis TaxID=981085 RepID=W9R2K7_9ROSA|nr:hypothetical protein L484_022473 [Morus notabilis]